MCVTALRIRPRRRGARAARLRDRAERPRGFTLIELVIVVAVVVALLAFLAPLVGRIEARRQRLACAANLHSIGTATASFALDHSRRLPAHYGGGAISFDTFWMRRNNGEYVNLGLLLDYVGTPEQFYCISHDGGSSPNIAFDTPPNNWYRRSKVSRGGDGFRAPSGLMGLPSLAGLDRPPVKHDPPNGVNSSYPARSRDYPREGLPRWSMLNYTNKVIYSDFIGVDGWPARGRFSDALRAPHDSQGYNRLFGDGLVAWVDSEKINAFRPVDADEPTPEQLHEYYKLLDVLP